MNTLMIFMENHIYTDILKNLIRLKKIILVKWIENVDTVTPTILKLKQLTEILPRAVIKALLFFHHLKKYHKHKRIIYRSLFFFHFRYF